MSTHQVGPDRGSLLLRTSRTGLGARAGHDLTIEVTRWSGEVVIGSDPAASTVRVAADTGSIRVLDGTGGLKPLTEGDKQEIQRTASRILDTDRHPHATFVSDRVAGDGSGGGTVDGALTLLGVDRPFRLDVTDLGGGRYRANGAVVQSDYGIRPYTAFLGALKLADRVAVEVELDLSSGGS